MKLFTYGTLRKGQYAHELLHGATFLGEDVLDNTLILVTLAFPAVAEPGNATIPGEVYEVPDCLWPRIDHYEGVPFLFKRHERALRSGEKAQVYLFA